MDGYRQKTFMTFWFDANCVGPDHSLINFYSKDINNKFQLTIGIIFSSLCAYYDLYLFHLECVNRNKTG